VPDTGPGTSTDTGTDLDPRLSGIDGGDHERLAHIVVPASKVTEAMVTGAPCTALCGKTWVPSRDPKRYPV
jgi:hypothetical protein